MTLLAQQSPVALVRYSQVSELLWIAASSPNGHIEADSTRHVGTRNGVSVALRGEVEVTRLKSRSTLYVTPQGVASKFLPVEFIADPLEKVTGPDLAPSTNLREWLLWKLANMDIGDYIIVPYQSAIVTRNATRTYSILYQGNITTIPGKSHSECLINILTWLTCVVCTENTIEKPNAAYLYQQWCSHFTTRILVKRREQFLTEMLAYEPEPICFQMPGLFMDMPMWEMLVPQLAANQFINVNALCAVLARSERDIYWLLYRNKVYDFVREKDDYGQFEQTTAELRHELIEKVRLLMKLQAV